MAHLRDPYYVPIHIRIEFGDEEIKNMERQFQAFDTSGDGDIDGEEVGALLRHLGEEVTDAKIERVMRECDKDGSGSVDFGEFVKVRKKKEKKRVPSLRVLL
jgi:Ca2+-binding EF-hand superfamily protein